MRSNKKNDRTSYGNISRTAGRARSGHCARMLGVLSDQLDRESRRRLCRRIEEHLKDCPECRVYVDTLKKTVVLYRSLGPTEVPWPVEKRLFKTIRLAGLRKAGQAGPKGKKRNKSAQIRG